MCAKIEGIECKSVTGPGRSGAIASVYASHFLDVPWVAPGAPIPDDLKPALVIDTSQVSGRTLREAAEAVNGIPLAVFQGRIRLWYEPTPLLMEP